jgi:F0F1-type ATP synthase membrane subunit b/b'
VKDINPVFYLFVVVAIIFLWFALAFLFKPIGRFFIRLWEDVKREMNSEEKENKN